MTCLNPGRGGGGGTLVYLYYMSNIEAWPIFSGRLTKVDGRVVLSDHAAFREVARTDIFGLLTGRKWQIWEGVRARPF